MDMKLYLYLLANSSGLKREVGESKTAITRFVQGLKREFNAPPPLSGLLALQSLRPPSVDTIEFLKRLAVTSDAGRQFVLQFKE